jgi:hypothetical protein
MKMGRVVLLNALVAPNKTFAIHGTPISAKTAKMLIYMKHAQGYEIKNFIGHPKTCELVGEAMDLELQPNRDEYDPKEDDEVIVVWLDKRMDKPGEAMDIKLDDLRFFKVKYILAYNWR